MTWNLKISGQKVFEKIPGKDQRLIASALGIMEIDPFKGDIKRLHNERSNFRKRVGN